MKKIFFLFQFFFSIIFINNSYGSQPLAKPKISEEVQIFRAYLKTLTIKMDAVCADPRFDITLQHPKLELSKMNAKLFKIEEALDAILKPNARSPKHKASPSAPITIPSPKKTSAATALMVAGPSLHAAALANGADQKTTMEKGYEQRKLEQQQKMAHIATMARRSSASSMPVGKDTLNAEQLNPRLKKERELTDFVAELLGLEETKLEKLVSKLHLNGHNKDQAKKAIDNWSIQQMQYAGDADIAKFKNLLLALNDKKKQSILEAFKALNQIDRTIHNQLPARIAFAFSTMQPEHLAQLHLLLEEAIEATETE